MSGYFNTASRKKTRRQRQTRLINWQSLRRSLRSLRLENLEDRSLLSVSVGGETLANAAVMASAAPAASTTALLGATFNTKIAIPESTTGQWVGYDIDGRSLPANAVVTKIILHHTVQHPRVSDLQVRLTADDGTDWLFRKNTGGWVTNFDEYRTDTTVFAGKSAAQMFHYQITDSVANNLKGTLQGLEIWITYSVPIIAPDLTVTASHTGVFSQGQSGANYTLNVQNVGNGPTSGTVNLSNLLPAGVTATAFSGQGWTTDLTTMTATRSDSLAAGASYAPLNITVNIAPNAPLSLTNSVQVAGGNETNTSNNAATDTATVTPLPNLTASITHAGNFLAGQPGVFTITVSNQGGATTSGVVSLTDLLPAGVTATSFTGNGWTIDPATLTATRSDSLAPAASFAPLTLVVAVPANASGTITNTAQVAGGGQIYTPDDRATDIAAILGSLPVLVGKNFSVSNARDGQTITVNYRVSSSSSTTLLLGCSIVGPDGIVVSDPSNVPQVTVAPGVNWYSRSFQINLPPAAVTGAYSATWTISGSGVTSSATQAAAITIDPAIAVRIPILMYHNIETTPSDYYTVSTSQFTAQMKALKAYGYTTVSFQDVLDYRAGIKTPPAKPIIISFDDAYQSLLNIVLPIISDPSIDFRVTGFVNTADVRGATETGGYPTDPLSWSEIRILDASGHVDIESHTVNHYDLATLTPAALTTELVNSKATIEQQLNLNKQPGDALKQVNFIAYPFGSYNSTVEQAVWQAGYRGAAAVVDQVDTTAADKFGLDRVQMTRNTSVQLDQSGWWEFFGNRIEEPALVVPSITINNIQYSATTVQPGQSVTIKVNVKNSGSPAPVIATLTIDSDNNHTNGTIYNSHTASQDIQRTAPWGTSSFEWTWTVPSNAPSGLYYATVQFNDTKYVFVFRTSPWSTAFQVVPATTVLAAALAGQSSSATTTTTLLSSATPASSTVAAYDAVLAKSASSTGSPASPAAKTTSAIQTLAQSVAAKTTALGKPTTTLAAAVDAVLGKPLTASLGKII